MSEPKICCWCLREGHHSNNCPSPRPKAIAVGDAIIALTRRQHQILVLVGEGDEDKHIARKLGIAASTVKDHAHAACRAIGGRNRAHACAMAARMGVI